MSDILKDFNGRFNKKNILLLIGAAFDSAVAFFNSASLIYVASASSSLTVNFNMRINNYDDSLIVHTFLTIVFILTSSLYICYSIDNIIANKQIENFRANPWSNTYTDNTSVNDVSKEQIRYRLRLTFYRLFI
ncbi:MAG: hypothetical protein ACR5KV_02000 [Wolbachia sp.]